MLHLPNEDDIRLTKNYTEAFALTLLWNVGVVGIIVSALFVAFFILKQYQLRVARNEAMRESMLTVTERSSEVVIKEGDGSIQQEQVSISPKSTIFKIINLLTSLCFYLLWVFITLFYLVFYMFGTFGRGTHIDVLSVFIMTLGVTIPTLLWKHKTKTRSWQKLRGETIFTIISLILWLAISAFLVVATKGTCVCYYNDQFGFKVSKDVRISTEFTRIIELQPPCPSTSVCHLYATVPEDASTAVFFNVHAGIDLSTLVFTLKNKGAVVMIKNSSSPFRMDNVESIGQRNVHSVLFTGLVADTLYSLEVIDQAGSLLKVSNYKTVPGADAAQLKLAVGGDLGMTKQGQKVTSYLKDFEPDAIILGGDTTYDDGMRSCYNTWDEFYTMFEPIYAKLDRLVPLILSVGNHDVGFDALTENSISSQPEELPLFFYFNPQHSAKTREVPDLSERLSFHYHKLGPTIHFNLDSGYLKKPSEQTDFIRLHSKDNANLYRFANYHNPIYPSCTNSIPGSNDMKVIEEGMRNWTPAFDELGFVASMEHHTHKRKFTYKIKNNTLNEGGTRYIGDGSWGVTEQACPDDRLTPRLELMESFDNAKTNHMWQVTLRRTNAQIRSYQISYVAVNLEGSVVTEKIEDLPPLQ